MEEKPVILFAQPQFSGEIDPTTASASRDKPCSQSGSAAREPKPQLPGEVSQPPRENRRIIVRRSEASNLRAGGGGRVHARASEEKCGRPGVQASVRARRIGGKPSEGSLESGSARFPEGGKDRVAHTRARIAIIPIALIFDPRHRATFEVATQLSTRDPEQGTDESVAPRRDPPETPESRTSHQPQEHGFHLVIPLVGQCDAVGPDPIGLRLEKAIAGTAIRDLSSGEPPRPPDSARDTQARGHALYPVGLFR